MLTFLDPFRFVLIAVAGWMNQRHFVPPVNFVWRVSTKL